MDGRDSFDPQERPAEMTSAAPMLYVVVVFDPESGEFERIAGVYTTREAADEVADVKWYHVYVVKPDEPEVFVND